MKQRHRAETAIALFLALWLIALRLLGQPHTIERMDPRETAYAVGVNVA